MEGKTQETAAAKAGMSVRSARKWQSGPLPSETRQERTWRTRPDPFDGVWEDEIEPLLQGKAAGALKATTIIEWLEEQHPGRFSASQLRTLQRRLQDWRALHGPEREVYFPQEHPPGREAQIDFTHCGELQVTIAGQPYRHLMFQLILSHSGWRYAEIAAGETFLALQKGLQNALWTLGGIPQILRSDNLSAATHEVKRSGGRALNDNYAALLDHYGLRSTRINRGQSHENGVAEQAHYRLKDAIDQALMLRGSRDFDSIDDYASFVRQMVERRNRLVEGKLEQEMACLRPLPPAPVPEYVNYRAKVRKWSTIQAAGRTYSVPSRLIGKEVQIRLYADWVAVYYKDHLVERMERVHGEGEANVNYRHVIGSLVRKPGAFARYRFREQLFPTMQFRLTYDALTEWRGERADVEYVRILHLAATTMEATVDSALFLLLEAGQPFDYGEVRDLAEPKPPEAPLLTVRTAPDLKVYDGLLAGSRPRRGCAHDGQRHHAGAHRSAVRPIQAAHHGGGSGGPLHRRRPRRRPAHLPRSTRAGGRGSEATAHQPAAPKIQAALGQDLGNLRAQPSPPGAAPSTGSSGPGQLRRAGRQRPGLRAARHRQDPRPVRHRPPPGGSGPLRPLRSRLPPGAGTAGCQARPGLAPSITQTGQLRLPAHR